MCLIVKKNYNQFGSYINLRLPPNQVRIQRGGQGVRTPPPPPGKSQVIWVSIGNKQLDPPWKKVGPPLENVRPPLEP